MIAIIGGGPAGIALGRNLDRLGMPWTLFEARDLASTWKRAPPELTVLSPWWTNILSARSLLKHWPLRKVPARLYASHLEELARDLRGSVVENTAVTRIMTEGDGRWSLLDQEGRHLGTYDAVVIATGYFSNPKPPCPDFSHDGSRPVLHAAELRDYGSLLSLVDEPGSKGPVLVVGRRVTAGQILIALTERNIPTAISLRSATEYRRSGMVAWLREMAYYVWEELEAWRHPRLRRNSYPPMEGGRLRRLIESGRIPKFGVPRTLRDGVVQFHDGSQLPVGAVVLATGYAPAVCPFSNVVDLQPDGRFRTVGDYESMCAPGVYLLGYDNLYDHRSRYLRGIRLDARRLARLLYLRYSASALSRTGSLR
ncbi:NAD(P)-binding domain-containing protein [Sinimarinibacterium thermocellulolyticum]|uniref:NAD(P)-binding domain-containing protein n=1 Tax=Sinimarinibacterium thermocellulolyticum TaxID=3170016 RepID=A0ABV2A926_9GAMM